MNAPWRKLIRLAGLLFATFFLHGCPVYPAFQNPNIDYNGRWGEVGDGAVATNPYEYEEPLRTMDQWTDGAYGSAYDDRNQLTP